MNMMWRVGPEHPNTLGHLEAQEAICRACNTSPPRILWSAGHGARYVAKPLNRIALAMRGRRGCHDISRDAETLAGVPSSISLSLSVDGARRQAWTTRDKEVGPATCHPDVPHMSTARARCRSCHEAAWKSWHESIDGEVREWRRRLCEQSSHSWSPDECVRCDATRCRAHYFDGQRCRHAVPCKDHPLPPPVSPRSTADVGQD